ncbi:hypothetical protein GCM10027431_20510 [Lysobacter rhizosphaerae]
MWFGRRKEPKLRGKLGSKGNGRKARGSGLRRERNGSARARTTNKTNGYATQSASPTEWSESDAGHAVGGVGECDTQHTIIRTAWAAGLNLPPDSQETGQA